MATTNLTKKEISNYLKDIKKALVCKNPKTKKMLADFKNSVFTYSEENPDATIDDVKLHFGEPAVVAEEFNVGYDDGYIKRYNALKKIELVAIVAVVVLAIAIGAFAMTIFYDKEYNAPVYYDTDIIVDEGDI